MGKDRTLRFLQQKYYWPGMTKDVTEYCRECHECQVNNEPAFKPAGIGHTMPIPTYPGEMTAIDFAGPFPPSHGKTHVLIIVDHLTTQCFLRALPPNFTAIDVIDLYVEVVFPQWGPTSRIIQDRDRRFTSIFYTEVSKAFNVRLHQSTAYHQNTNGQAERFIRTMKTMLRKYTMYNPDKWAKLLHHCEMGYNWAPTRFSDLSPIELAHGVASKPQFLGFWVPSKAPSVNEYMRRCANEHTTAMDALAQARYLDEKSRRGKRSGVRFAVGDYVLVLRARTADSARQRSLETIWTGPYRVDEVEDETGNLHLELPIPLQYRHPWVATDICKKYYGELPELRKDEADPIEFIIQHRRFEHDLQYLIRWRGFGVTDDTWESDDWVKRQFPQKVTTYWASHTTDIGRRYGETSNADERDSQLADTELIEESDEGLEMK
jgi:hypothetical protein